MRHHIIRRIAIGIGAAVMVGGWGMTNFATDARNLHDTWIYPEYRQQVAHATYLGGLWMQALGAGLLVAFIPAFTCAPAASPDPAPQTTASPLAT
ncbi:MAG: hypothetical protein KDA30_14925 [Phycisphaerales bacterium]|nr:hypothetical protein [Phycisphaerales bacterium]